MKIFDNHKLIELGMKSVGLPSVYVNNHLDFTNDEDSAVWAYICSKIKDADVLSSLITSGVFFFDTIDEAHKFYKVFSDQQVYSSGLYATLNDHNGICLDENT